MLPNETHRRAFLATLGAAVAFRRITVLGQAPARALGLAIPQSLLVRAAHIIE